MQTESNCHLGVVAYPIGQETLCLGRATTTLCIENFKRHSLAPAVRCVVRDRQAYGLGWGYTCVERPVV